MRRNQSDPHVCLLCGGILARGANSYKERHWNQKHLDEKNTNFQTLIVPKNHIKAQELLKRNDVCPTEGEADLEAENVSVRENDVPLNADLTAPGDDVYIYTTASSNDNDSDDDDKC